MVKPGKQCLDFTGKVVVITGASSGIGAATSLMFSKLGACLALIDKNESTLAQTAKKCKEIGYEPYALSADLMETADIKCAANKIIDRFNKVDVLVNGAGIMPMADIHKTDLKLWDCVFNTNMRSTFYLTKLLVDVLIKAKGNIINISSVCGLRAFPNLVAYNMSKAAIDHFTRSLALDLGAKNVRVNAVNPGVIRTNLQKSGGMDEAAYKEFMERSKKTHALGRVGEPEEVAAAICFLASNMASFITGVTLSVDGGKQVMCPR